MLWNLGHCRVLCKNNWYSASFQWLEEFLSITGKNGPPSSACGECFLSLWSHRSQCPFSTYQKVSEWIIKGYNRLVLNHTSFDRIAGWSNKIDITHWKHSLNWILYPFNSFDTCGRAMTTIAKVLKSLGLLNMDIIRALVPFIRHAFA